MNSSFNLDGYVGLIDMPKDMNDIVVMYAGATMFVTETTLTNKSYGVFDFTNIYTKAGVITSVKIYYKTTVGTTYSLLSEVTDIEIDDDGAFSVNIAVPTNFYGTTDYDFKAEFYNPIGKIALWQDTTQAILYCEDVTFNGINDLEELVEVLFLTVDNQDIIEEDMGPGASYVLSTMTQRTLALSWFDFTSVTVDGNEWLYDDCKLKLPLPSNRLEWYDLVEGEYEADEDRDMPLMNGYPAVNTDFPITIDYKWCKSVTEYIVYMCIDDTENAVLTNERPGKNVNNVKSTNDNWFVCGKTRETSIRIEVPVNKYISVWVGARTPLTKSTLGEKYMRTD